MRLRRVIIGKCFVLNFVVVLAGGGGVLVFFFAFLIFLVLFLLKRGMLSVPEFLPSANVSDLG